MGHRKAYINGIVVCMDKKRTVLNPGHIVIEDDKIVQVTGNINDIAVSEFIDSANKVVFPGLVNTHAHMRPVRGLGDGLGTWDWHVQYVDKISAAMTEEDAYVGGMMTFAESLSCGVTTIQGMTIYGEPELQAAREAGLRVRLVPHAEDYHALNEHNRKVLDQDGSEEDLTRFWLGMEITPCFSQDQLQEVRRIADKTGSRIHTHFSEWEREPLELLVKSDFLCKNLTLAHCIHVNDEEIAIMASHGVSVSHNPKSNMKTGSGIAPILKMRKMGMNVALGTDGPLCTYKLDQWEEIRTAAMLQRVAAENAKVLDAWDVLEMATINGAKAMGMERDIGSIETGKKADLILIDTEKIHCCPLDPDGKHNNIASILAFSVSGSDIVEVMVNGRVLLRDGIFLELDNKRLLEEVKESSKRILAKV